MELTESVKALLIETARALKGSDRRIFMARTVKELGPGGQRRAERELGWNRVTIRKGMRELEGGMVCLDAAARGRKPVEAHLPNLLSDIREIVERQRHEDPRCHNDLHSTCMSAVEVRRRLIAHKGYTDQELPSVQTIAARLKAMGYNPRRGSKIQYPITR